MNPLPEATSKDPRSLNNEFLSETIEDAINKELSKLHSEKTKEVLIVFINDMINAHHSSSILSRVALANIEKRIKKDPIIHVALLDILLYVSLRVGSEEVDEFIRKVCNLYSSVTAIDANNLLNEKIRTVTEYDYEELMSYVYGNVHTKAVILLNYGINKGVSLIGVEGKEDTA